MAEHGDDAGERARPCPSCGRPVPARPSGHPGVARGSCGSCGSCGLQLVRRHDEPAWREIRG